MGGCNFVISGKVEVVGRGLVYQLQRVMEMFNKYIIFRGKIEGCLISLYLVYNKNKNLRKDDLEIQYNFFSNFLINLQKLS